MADDPASSATQRHFYAHERGIGRQGGHMIRDADDFSDAAMLFAERWGDDTPDGGLSVIVRDCESGEEHCFMVDMGEDEARPC